jgi:hypothetical protein
MRVKIGNWWYAPQPGFPIMVELSEADKVNIANMKSDATKYACFDEKDPLDEEGRKRWMKG